MLHVVELQDNYKKSSLGKSIFTMKKSFPASTTSIPPNGLPIVFDGPFIVRNPINFPKSFTIKTFFHESYNYY